MEHIGVNFTCKYRDTVTILNSLFHLFIYYVQLGIDHLRPRAGEDILLNGGGGLLFITKDQHQFIFQTKTFLNKCHLLNKRGQ